MSVNHTLSDAAALVEPMAGAKNLKLIVKLLNEDQSIQTDGTKLRQMLVNLLSNGIKFTEKGEVSLGCAVSDAVLEVSIADTGVGIAAENIEYVFEPFWQADEKNGRDRARTQRDEKTCPATGWRCDGREQNRSRNDISADASDESSRRRNGTPSRHAYYTHESGLRAKDVAARMQSFAN
jgi:anti-sigma regulatory factor (Ser/Thr protein kinase)